MTIISVASLNEVNVLLADTIACNDDNSTYIEDKITRFNDYRFFSFIGNGVFHVACNFLCEWSHYCNYNLTLNTRKEMMDLIHVAVIYDDLLEIETGERTKIKDSTVYKIDGESVIYWDILPDLIHKRWYLSTSHPSELGSSQYHHNFFGTKTTKGCLNNFQKEDLLSSVESKINLCVNDKNLPYTPTKNFSMVAVDKTVQLKPSITKYAKRPYEDLTDYMVCWALKSSKKVNELRDYQAKHKWSPF